MNEKMEKKLVGHMLYHKEHGYSVTYILRTSAIRYLLIIAIFASCVILNRTGFLVGGGLIFLTGMIVGALLRDARWIRQGKRMWPLYDKVIDWTKVKEIADKTMP